MLKKYITLPALPNFTQGLAKLAAVTGSKSETKISPNIVTTSAEKNLTYPRRLDKYKSKTAILKLF